MNPERDIKPALISLSGTPEEVGYKHGEVLRSNIRSLFDMRYSIILESTRASSETICQVCKEILFHTKRHLPKTSEEILATSKAANIEPWKLVVAGGFSDVLDQCGKLTGVETNSNECSLISITLGDGRPLLVGTWDSHASAQDSLILVDRHIDGLPRIISLSTAGWPMQQGLNEHGLGFAIANMVAKTSTKGTSYICALTAVAASVSASSAAQRASQIPLCSARYYSFIDESGKAIGVEHDGINSNEVNGRLAHTNHFISKSGTKVEGRPEILPESKGRQALVEMLFSSRSHQSINEVFDLLSSKEPDDFSVIKHGKGLEDRTCAVFAISPADQTIWYTSGPSKLNKIRSISISGN